MLLDKIVQPTAINDPIFVSISEQCYVQTCLKDKVKGLSVHFMTLNHIFFIFSSEKEKVLQLNMGLE